MKEDKKAIFTAAGQAQRAASFLMGFAPDDPEFGPTRPVEGPTEGGPEGTTPT
jgi:antirestriction protein ArdC